MGAHDRIPCYLDIQGLHVPIHLDLWQKIPNKSMDRSKRIKHTEHSLDARRILGPPDEGTTPRVLIIGIPATAEEQDGHSKPKKPNAS
jgi:hypothetical protein